MVILEANLCFLFFTQNARWQCNKAYGEKQRVHFDANAQAVSGRTFATKKTGEDGRPLHVNEDDDAGKCSTDREGGGESGGDSLSNRKASDGSGRLR